MTPRHEPRIVDWYRADAWPRMRRILVTGPFVLTAGGLVIALSFLTRQPLDVRIAAAAVGFALIFGGAVSTLLVMHKILRDEVSVVVRTDGIAVQDARGETLVAWDDLSGATWDGARGALVIERASAGPLVVARTFVGLAGPELAARLLQHKRRADLKLPN